jgi:non-ribosomal peptide synthetase component E (peptide arylation enzyme)
MIIRAGQNVYPAEIENLLLTCPKVSQAVLIGIPDPVLGERACACIVAVPGESLTFEEMIAFLKAKGLAVHKLPERLVVMEQFPHLVDGQKVDKIGLKKWSSKRQRQNKPPAASSGIKIQNTEFRSGRRAEFWLLILDAEC